MVWPDVGAGLRPSLRFCAVVGCAVLALAACGSDRDPGPAFDGSRSGAVGSTVMALTDIADEVGLDMVHGAFQWGATGDTTAMMGGGLCWIDADDDGWLDLFVVNTWSDGEWGRWREAGGLPTTRLFSNRRGRFTDVSVEAGAALEVRGTGCLAADLDDDGHTDLYVTSERENVLLWNDGEGGFETDDGSAGVDAFGWHAGAAAGDVDGDGDLDLFVAGYADLNRPVTGVDKGFPNTFEPEADLLFLNDGAGPDTRPRFVETATAVGIEADQVDYGLGAVLTDVDGDHDLDLYVANDTHPNRLYRNETSAEAPGFRFVDVASSAGVADENAGMGVASAQVDQAEGPELTVTNLDEQGHRIHRSRQLDPPRWDDARADLGVPDLGVGLVGWGTGWHDLDLDGDLDLTTAHGAVPVRDLLADRQPLQVHLLEAGTLVDATDAVVTGDDGLLLGRGLAVADHDNDGDLDLAVASIGSPLALLGNTGATGHWLGVRPVPSDPGTTVTIRRPDGSTAVAEIQAGSSYLSAEDPRAHFGLGPHTRVEAVEVRWPDGATNLLEDLPADQWVEVRPR